MMVAAYRELLRDNHRTKVLTVVQAVAVVSVAEFQICIFRVMAARSSSANATQSIQLGYRHRDQQREQERQPPREPPRQQPQVQVAKLPDDESISTFAFVSIVPRNGRRCSTMDGER